MQVILLERIEKLGQMGEVVAVKPGFARNFLLPKGKALRATEKNIKHFERQKVQLEAYNLELKSDAESVGNKMEGISVILVRQAGEAGQLYGSVNARDISQALSNEGFTITRGQVRLEQPIKTLGLHDVSVTLHPDVTVNISANVARSNDEAKTQAKTGRAVLSQAEEEARAEIDMASDSEANEAIAKQAEKIFDEGAIPETARQEFDVGSIQESPDKEKQSHNDEEKVEI